MFKTPYKRPEKFSNPYDHISDKELKGVLDTADLDMDWSDYCIIFHLTPISSYQESCYFLPFALQYINNNPDNSLDCSTEIIWFISEHIGSLKKDGLFEKCEDSLKACLNTWTKNFAVEHFDKEACRKKEWVIDHDDGVENSQLLIESLDDMVFYESLANIAFDFIAEIRSSETGIQCAWYLELCNINKVYNCCIQCEKLKEFLADQKYIDRCSDIVKKTSFMDQVTSPTYWNDVCGRLNIA